MLEHILLSSLFKTNYNPHLLLCWHGCVIALWRILSIFNMTRISLLTILAIFYLGLGACDSGSGMTDDPVVDDPINDPPPMEDPEFERSEMLANMGNNIIIPAYTAFQGAVDALDVAGQAFESAPSLESLATLQEALKEARLAWQDVSLFQFGPAETFALRGSLNTYPANTDQVDANMASGSYVLGTLGNIAAGGFPALGYLLHGAEFSQEELVTLFTTDASAASRMKYVVDNLEFIKTNVDLVANQWMPAGGNYIETFLSEDNGGVDVGSSLGQLVNAMVLHYERFIRDGKVGIPAGVRSSGVPRPKTTEAYYGGYSVELAVQSVEALGRLYEGTSFAGEEGVGLNENLEFLEASSLADDITSTVENVVSSLEGLSDPLAKQIDSDVDEVVTAFTGMQQLVVLLKADMTSFLGVTITFQDNDGD